MTDPHGVSTEEFDDVQNALSEILLQLLLPVQQGELVHRTHRQLSPVPVHSNHSTLNNNN